MRTYRFIACLAVLSLSIGGASLAQAPHDTRISFVHPASGGLTEDLATILDLTSKEEQEQLANLQGFLEDLQLGVDSARPLRVDVLTGSTPFDYLMWIPYTDVEDLSLNIDGLLGFLIEDPNDPTLFQIDAAFEAGWMRLQEKNQYAVILMTTPELLEEKKKLVTGAGDPLPAIRDVLKRNVSFAATIANEAIDADSQAKRTKSFEALRAEDMADLKKRPDESQPAFELRQGTAEVIYDELQRILVQSRLIDVWSQLGRDDATMSLQFDCEAIADTQLAQAIAQAGQTPDAFAGITPVENSVLSGRLNHPVDELRQQNFSRWVSLLTAGIHDRIDQSKTLDDAAKQAKRKIYEGVAAIFEAGVASGNVNGFVEAQHDGSQFTLVGAVSAPGSAGLLETLQQLPSAHADNTLEENVLTEGDITVHRIQLAEGFVPQIDRVFGAGRSLLIGLGNEQVWLATGPGSEQLLKAKIGEMGDPQPAAALLTADIRLGPWASRLQELAKDSEAPTKVEEKTAWRERLLRLKQLSESLMAKDELHLELAVQDGHLTGSSRLNSGLLEFVGRQIAKFTKDNLE